MKFDILNIHLTNLIRIIDDTCSINSLNFNVSET